MKRRDLERALESIPDFVDPQANREQYRTPAGIAADLLWAAWTDGDIAGKHVLDLGSGTGMMALAAHMLGAAKVTGVESDEAAIQSAATQVPSATFIQADLADGIELVADTVVMNPPFGAQKGNRNADRTFLDAAVASGASAIWLLTPTVSEKFLAKYARDAGMEADKVLEWDYPLQATMAHHQDTVRTIKVGGYRLSR